jgi:hypothetical protein
MKSTVENLVGLFRNIKPCVLYFLNTQAIVRFGKYKCNRCFSVDEKWFKIKLASSNFFFNLVKPTSIFFTKHKGFQICAYFFSDFSGCQVISNFVIFHLKLQNTSESHVATLQQI